MQIIEIEKLKDQNQILEELYYEVLLKEFPNNDELESLDNIKFYLRNKKKLQLKKCNYHILVATINNKVVGGLIGDYYSDCNSSLIEYIATDKNYRNMGISKKLLNHFYDLQKKNANNNGRYEFDYIFIECENPLRFENNIDMISRLKYWNHQGYHKLDFKYIQSSLDKNKESVDFLDIFCYVNNKNLGHELSSQTIFKFLHDFQKYSLDIKNPLQNQEYLKMQNDNKKDTFKILI